MEFIWNPSKAARNLRRHGISFHEAATVFSDPLSTTVYDPDHSVEENRYITVGVSRNYRVIMVAHAEQNDHVRLISARQLTPKERRQYEQRNR